MRIKPMSQHTWPIWNAWSTNDPNCQKCHGNMNSHHFQTASFSSHENDVQYEKQCPKSNILSQVIWFCAILVYTFMDSWTYSFMKKQESNWNVNHVTFSSSKILILRVSQRKWCASQRKPRCRLRRGALFAKQSAKIFLAAIRIGPTVLIQNDKTC